MNDETPLRVLLIAQRDDVAGRIRAVFGDLPITLEHVSPEQALQTLLVSRADATLLDISPFPEVPLELIASIVAVAPHVPILVLVVNDVDSRAPAALAAGAHDVISSDAAAGVLVNRLRSAVAHHLDAHRDQPVSLRELVLRSSNPALLINRDGRITQANPAAVTLFGDLTGQLIGEPFGTPIVSNLVTTIEIPQRNGEPITAELFLLHVLDEHSGDAYLAILRAASRQHRLDVDLRLMIAAISSTSDGIVTADLDGVPYYQNPAFQAMVGLTLDDLRAAGGLQRLYRDPGVARAALAAVRNGQSYRGEMRLIDHHGNALSVHVNLDPVLDPSGRAIALIAVHTDVTQRKLTEARLAYLSSHDPLTGLANRTLLIDRLQQALDRQSRERSSPCGVLLINLDRFKQINDSLGHAVGDELLIAIAGRLKHITRPGDTVARFGGDEFAVVIDTPGSVEDIWRVAQRIQHTLSHPVMVREHSLTVGVSIGIAVDDGRAKDAMTLLHNADTALHQAKARGRSRIVMFEEAMHTEAARQLHLEIELRQAVQHQTLEMHYQPIVDLYSGEMYGFEALMRWQHPHHGLLFPDSFLPIAEEAGIIPTLGNWSIAEVCRQARRWRDRFGATADMPISVNIHSQHLDQADLFAQVQQILRHHRLPGAALTIEITEKAALNDLDLVLSQLLPLKALGVRVMLDDFGTGYSSLSHLARLPVDGVKIDRSFIQSMMHDPHAATIVRAVITLARELQLCVVAEGVETEEQRAMLLQLRCPYAQGWLFGRAADADTMTRMLAARPHMSQSCVG
jgi:diguanylate cyclase (GGDEF)-like protein/PAS domain S-box-containing protein